MNDVIPPQTWNDLKNTFIADCAALAASFEMLAASFTRNVTAMTAFNKAMNTKAKLNDSR